MSNANHSQALRKRLKNPKLLDDKEVNKFKITIFSSNNKVGRMFAILVDKEQTFFVFVYL